jgi:putative copper resistance protein D
VLPVTAAVVVAVSIAVLLVSLVVGGGAYAPSPEGLPDPGPVVGWGLPIARLATDLAAVLTVGWLLAAAFLDPQGRDGVVSRIGRQDLMRVAWAAAAWAWLAVIQLMLTLAQVLGIPLGEAIDPGVVSTYAWDIPTTRALALGALAAVAVGIGAVFTSRVGAAAAWLVLAVVGAALPALAGHAAGLGDHALATSAGTTHVVAATLWVGGLAALAVHAVRRDPGLRRGARSFGAIALVSIVLLAASGLANAYARLDSAEQLVTTGYGRLVVAKIVLILALAAAGARMRRRILPALDGPGSRAAFARLAAVEIVVMSSAIAIGVALAGSPPPRVETRLPTLGETLLGFPYPPPPDAAGVLFGFRLEPLFLVGALAAAALYVIGVVRLSRRGDRWSWTRTASWLGGIALVIWTTNAGIAAYAQVSIGMHMLQHMTMTMMAPILLVLGAPATLALRALPASKGPDRGPREWLLWLLHSPLTLVLTNPIYVFFVYVIGLYGLYMTPLFGFLMGSHVGHILMQVHFLASGYLFYWVVIGIDPRPRPLPYWGRFLLLLLALAVHGFFAVILMMGDTPLGVEWYSVVRPPWVTDLQADSGFGGQIAWGISEVPTLIVMVVLAFQWASSDDREARRRDRQADRDGDAELTAYNAQLAALADRDARREDRAGS